MAGLKAYTDAFRVNAGEPTWLTSWRRGALARASELGLPTRRQEAWRFTNLAPIEKTHFPPAAPGTGPEAATDARYRAADGGVRLVIANGRCGALSLGDPLAPKPRFVLAPTAAAGLMLEGKLDLGEARGSAAFPALNAGLYTDGFTLLVPEDAVIEPPIEVLHWADTDAPASIHTRNVVEIGRGAQATLIESFAGRGPYWTNDVTQIRVAEGASLRHVRLQDEAAEAVHTALTRVVIASGAAYESFTLTLGGQLSRQDIIAAIEGEKARLGLDGAYLLRGRQEATVATLVDHAAPGSATREVFKGVVDERAHGVFQGKIQVRQAAQQTDAHQLNKNLLLSERAAVDTKPELEIFADDVKCSHGATVGDLDETALFYLISRGLPEAEARSILIEAFAADAIDLVGDEAARSYLRRHLDGWLTRSRT